MPMDYVEREKWHRGWKDLNVLRLHPEDRRVTLTNETPYDDGSELPEHTM